MGAWEQSNRRFMRLAPLSLLNFFSLVFGVLLGFIALALPPMWIAGLPLAMTCLWVITRWPEIGVLLILGYTSTILHEDDMPLISLGVGSLHLSDLVVLWLFAVLAFRKATVKDFKLRRTPLDFPIVLFMTVSLLSTAKGIFFSTIEFHDGFRALRSIAYYSMFFLVTNLIDEKRQIRMLCGGLTVLASITAGAMLVQFAAGSSVAILSGRVESLDTAGIRHEAVTRMIPPGESLVYVGFVVACASLAWQATRERAFIKVVRISLLGVGLLLTFRRMLWGAAALSILVIGLLASPDHRARLARRAGAMVAALFLTVSIALLIKPESRFSATILATVERFGTIFDTKTYRRGDVDQVSLEMRAKELSYAIPQVFPPPLIGTGLRAPYRPCLPMDPEDCVAPTYIHNGHIAILLRLGIIGYAAYIWFSAVFLIRGFKHWRSLEGNDTRLRAIAYTAAYAGLLLAALLEPYFILWPWVPVLAIMLGSNEVFIRLSSSDQGSKD